MIKRTAKTARRFKGVSIVLFAISGLAYGFTGNNLLLLATCVNIINILLWDNLATTFEQDERKKAIEQDLT